ncbi:hypothetical protein [Mycobacterium ostraviense]|nr:hypothetical protein [Mycobacterium ostraviense]
MADGSRRSGQQLESSSERSWGCAPVWGDGNRVLMRLGRRLMAPSVP